MNETTKSEPTKKRNIRQIVLFGILIVVAAAYAYDRYVLMPSATEKIQEITNQVSRKLTDENRKQVHDIAGIKPASTFEHNGLEVEQYRFPRGLPFFPRPILDIAFEGDTIAFFRQEPIDIEYIEKNHRPKAVVDFSKKHDPGEPKIGF